MLGSASATLKKIQLALLTSSRGCTQEAIEIFESSRRSVTELGKTQGMCFYAPGKAANAGGVAVSGLEMAQNSQRVGRVSKSPFFLRAFPTFPLPSVARCFSYTFFPFLHPPPPSTPFASSG